MFTNENARTFAIGSLFLGKDQNNRLIGVPTDRHAVTIAGSRSGKGAGLIIPNLLRWPHNALVIDPKGENAENTYKQREKMGQAIYVLDPFESADVPDRIRASFNPLAAIDLKSNRARAIISAIANGLIVVHDPKHLEWTDGARALLSGIIAYVVAEAPPEHRTFASVREILMQPTELPADEDGNLQGLYADAQHMAQDTRVGGLIRTAGVTIMTAIDSEKSMEKDFLGLARRSTEWLDDEAIAACLNNSTFQLADLKSGNASVYLVLPADNDFLKTYGAFLRLFVKSALTAMGVGQSGKRCLFILDEFYSLGKLEEISEAAGRMPSYGVHLWPFLQNLGQLHELYGQSGTETFFANSDAHIFFGNTDPMTLEYVSKMIGNIRPEDVTEPPPTREYIDPRMDVLREVKSIDYEEKMKIHQHKMSVVGSPKIPPEQLRKLVSKPDDGIIAQSMMVFARGGEIYNLFLQPYFEPMPKPGENQPVWMQDWPSDNEFEAVFENYNLGDTAKKHCTKIAVWTLHHFPNSRGAKMGLLGTAGYLAETFHNNLEIPEYSFERWMRGIRTEEEYMKARDEYIQGDAPASPKQDRPAPTIKKKT